MNNDEYAVVSDSAFHSKEEQPRTDHCVINHPGRLPHLPLVSLKGIVGMRLDTRRKVKEKLSKIVNRLMVIV